MGKKGSIDFMCFPESDSPSIFCAHVDRRRGGRFQIEPLLEDCLEQQLYLPDTNVLLTRYLFEKTLGDSNAVGLFSEQLGGRGEFLGNVPQAFTHLAMISAAFDLDRRLSRDTPARVGGGMG